MSAADRGETVEVLDRHRFDVAALARYLKERLPDPTEPLEVRQFTGGQSNPTFLLTAGARRYVLRKKPPGQLLKSAHQIDREYRVMKALADTEVPVPGMVLLCEDESVIGTPFYVMDYIEGRVLRDPALPGLTPAARRSIYDSMNAVLATLHRVDPNAVGLGDFGRPGDYYQRQIHRWSQQYRASQTEDIPAMERLMEWLPGHVPADETVGIVHGDYRLENTICHPSEDRVIGVLDWELSTLGHPLADLAHNCIGYHMLTTDQSRLLSEDNARTGIPTEADYLAAYCRRTGRDGIPNWEFYMAFAIFRMAAIAQGVYKRGLDGIASSERARDFRDTCRLRAEKAWSLVDSNL